MTNKTYVYVGCTVCGLRYVEGETTPPTSGCNNCGSSTIALERGLSEEAAEILIKYGQREGTPEPTEPTGSTS